MLKIPEMEIRTPIIDPFIIIESGLGGSKSLTANIPRRKTVKMKTVEIIAL